MKDDKKFKKRLMSIGSFVCLFAIAGAITYALVPTTSVKGGSTGGDTTSSSGGTNGGGDDLSAGDKFIAKLSEGGLGGLVIDELSAEISIPNSKGNANVISIDKASGSFAMDELSMESVFFDLDIPLTYNGKTRQLDLTKTAENMYISASNPDDLDAWNVNYKISTEPQSYKDENGDTVTYSGGNLFYYIEAIAEAVAGCDAITSLLPKVSVDTSSLNINTDLLLESLGDIETKETSSGYKYYVNLALNEDLVLPLGFSSDKDINFTGVSFPHDQYGSDTFSFSNGMSVDLDLVCTPSEELSFSAPANESSYVELFDTKGYITNLFKYVNDGRFNVSADLGVSHKVSDSLTEKMGLVADISADINDITKPDMIGEVTLSSYENEEVVGSHYISAAYLPSQNSSGEADADAYLNVNNILKLHTSQSVVDGVIGNITESMKNFSTETSDASSSLLSLFDGLSDAIDAVKNSKLVTGVGNGDYSEVIPLIDTITAQSGSLSIGFDLSVLGMSGTVTATLKEESDTSSDFVSIDFNNVGFYTFTLDGSVGVSALPESTTLTVDSTGYHDLWRLDPMSKQIADFLDSQSLAFSVEGSYLNNSLTDNNGNTGVGFTFDGTAALDLVNDCGTGEIQFTDRQEAYVQSHYVDIDVMGPEHEGESSSLLSADTANVNNMLFDYSTSGPASDSSRDSSLLGRFSISSLNDIIDLVMQLAGSTDARITRFTAPITEATTTSLIGSLTSGEYFSLMEYKIITNVEYSDNWTLFTLEGKALGLSDDIDIKLLYFNDDGSLSGINVITDISSSTLDLTINIDQIDLGESYFQTSSNWKFGLTPDLSSFTDFSSMSRLLNYVKGSATLGNGLDSSNPDLATYHLTGGVDLDFIGFIPVFSCDVDFYISLDGDAVSVYGYVDSRYIRYDCNTYIYFATDLDNGSGNIYMSREYQVSSGFLGLGKTTKYDSVLVSANDFSSNMLDWIFNYILNMGISSLSGSGSDSSDPIKVDKVFDVDGGCFNYSEDSSGNPNWDMTISLAELANMSILGSAGISISGSTVLSQDGQKSWQTLSSMSLTTSFSGIVSLFADVTFSLELANVEGGVYTECWSDVASAFSGTYTDSLRNGTPTYSAPGVAYSAS